MRSRVLMSLVMVVGLLSLIPVLLFFLLNEKNDSLGGTTIGVVLAGDAALYGWPEVANTAAQFPELVLDSHRVLVFEELNTADATLDGVVGGLVERGVDVVFLSRGILAAESGLATTYPNVVFIENLATRAEVEALLPALPVTTTAAPETTTSTEANNPGPLVWGIVCLASVVLVGMVALSARERILEQLPPEVHKRSKRKRSRTAGVHGRALSIEARARTFASDFGADAPLVHRFSTYVDGDLYFDESFSIEQADMTFLGECGISVAATASVDQQVKPTAFEVWLFDAQNTNTQTRILASQYANQKGRLLGELSIKGPVLLAEPDATIELRTPGLLMRARVLMMGYLIGVPPATAFDYLVLEIAIWPQAHQP